MEAAPSSFGDPARSPLFDVYLAPFAPRHGATRTSLLLSVLLFALVPAATAQHDGPPPEGRAIIVVTTEPDVDGERLRFTGIPEGEVLLHLDRPDSLVVGGPASGRYTSTLSPLSPPSWSRGQ